MERTRRKYPRKRVYLPVEYTSEGSTGRTHAWTLGGGGLFLGASGKIAVGTELTVRFRPAQHLPIVEAKATVRYLLPNQGIGIEFTGIKPEDRDMILLQIGHRMAEKRRFPRVPLAVQVEHNGGSVIGMSRDISAGGMFIETRQTASGISSFRLRFNLDDGGPIVKVTVAVRYVVGEFGVGVEFIDLSPADRDRIETYVSKGEPSL
jgi:PilZ domain